MKWKFCLGVLTMFPAIGSAQISIGSLADLQKIGRDPAYPLDGDYVLTADIDASITADPNYNSGHGWEPIGKKSATDSTPQFSGTFDGDFHTIDGLTVDLPAPHTYAGLFGELRWATIRNLKITNADIRGDWAGPVAGFSSSTIEQVYTHGRVLPYTFGGGLVGYAPNEVIERCFTRVEHVFDPASSTEFGGMTAAFLSAAIITDSFTNGDSFSGTSGGLAWRGGSAQITNVWTSGSMGRGLVWTDVPFVTASYYDKTDMDFSSIVGDARTRTEMTTTPYAGDLYVDWDFDNVWVEDVNGLNEGFPFLAWYTDRVTLSYAAGPGGSISGQANQTRLPHVDGEPVTATPDDGYVFVQWSDGFNNPTRQHLEVEEDISLTANFQDVQAPTSTATANGAGFAGGPVRGTYTATDNSGSVSEVFLYHRSEVGNWNSLGPVTGGVWTHTPAMEGPHFYAAVATDGAGNSESVPSGGSGTGETEVWFNPAPNGALQLAVPTGAPITVVAEPKPGITVIIEFANVNQAGTVTIARSEGDVFPSGFANGHQFADFSIDLQATGGLAFSQATITIGYEDIDGGFPESLLDRAWRDDAGTVTAFPIVLDNVANTIRVEDVPGFSTWYFGNSAGLPVELDSFAVE